MIQEINLKGITDSLFTDIQNSLIEKAMKEYARIKCQELLLLVTEKAMIETDNDCYGKMIVKSTYSTEREQGFSSTTTISINKDSILNVVDLDKFCS